MSALILPDFGSTHHLSYVVNPNAVTREDKVATEADSNVIFTAQRVEFAEKVDGACCGIHFVGDELLVRNRNHLLTKGFTSRKTAAQSQFSSVWNWIYDHRAQFEALAQVIDGAVYGEWMHFAHGIHYTALPSKFIAHSLYDMRQRIWVDPLNARQMLQDAGFTMPPAFPRPADLKALQWLLGGPSGLVTWPAADLPGSAPWAGPTTREGVYIKIGDGERTTHRYKIVRADFLPGCMFGSGLKNIVKS